MKKYIWMYCIFLWLTNWTRSHAYDREGGLSYESIDMRGFGILFGLVVSIVLLRRIWNLIRMRLDSGLRIPAEVRLWGLWSYLLLLVPMAFNFVHHSSGVATDGAIIHTVFEYGGDASGFSIAFSGMAIMLFQTLVNLEACYSNNFAEQGGASDR